jgi:hypothetical protein
MTSLPVAPEAETAMSLAFSGYRAGYGIRASRL